MIDATAVRAEAVDLRDLATLPIGTSLAWRQLTATHEAPYPPHGNEPPPDYTVCADEAGKRLRVLRFSPLGLVLDEHRTWSPATLSIAAALEAIGSGPDADPVCAFGTSVEPNPGGEGDVPWLAVWTGPVWDAADVDATWPGPDIRGSRIRYRGMLSHRVNAVEGSGIDPKERLHLQQYANGGWLLRSGAHQPTIVVRRRSGLATLTDVLDWAVELSRPGAAETEPFTAFTVSMVQADAPMTVRVW